jgi:hypothetical protein
MTTHKDNVFKKFPLVMIVKREPDENGYIHIHHGEHFTDASIVNAWQFVSIQGLAIENNECPVEAVNKAKEIGHDLHFVKKICLDNASLPKPNRILLSLEDVLSFEGYLFKLIPSLDKNILLERT